MARRALGSSGPFRSDFRRCDGAARGAFKRGWPGPGRSVPGGARARGELALRRRRPPLRARATRSARSVRRLFPRAGAGARLARIRPALASPSAWRCLLGRVHLPPGATRRRRATTRAVAPLRNPLAGGYRAALPGSLPRRARGDHGRLHRATPGGVLPYLVSALGDAGTLDLLAGSSRPGLGRDRTSGRPSARARPRFGRGGRGSGPGLPAAPGQTTHWRRLDRAAGVLPALRLPALAVLSWLSSEVVGALWGA